MLDAQYAVRGALVLRAMQHERALGQGAKLPFDVRKLLFVLCCYLDFWWFVLSSFAGNFFLQHWEPTSAQPTTYHILSTGAMRVVGVHKLML